MPGISRISLARAAMALFITTIGSAACATAVPATQPLAASSGPTVAPVASSIASQPTDAGEAAQPLLVDPAATHSIGDTARLSGGEFVGDQADLTVVEAVVLPGSDVETSHYAFLVEITGLDAETFPYNLRDFRLIDNETFQYEPLFDAGEAPRLEFGDLSPSQRVRGWLTFAAPNDTAGVELQYSPALALEPATFGFLVP